MEQKQILVVDDEKNIRLTMAQSLERDALDEESATDYGTLMELAKRHISDRRFDAAREVTQRAIANDPAQPGAYNLYGALLEIKGDRLEAQKLYRAALDIDPTYKPARANLDRTTSWHKFGQIQLESEREQVKSAKEERNGEGQEG